MAYLSAIIQAVESHFQVSIQGDPYPRTLINGVRFIDKNDAEISHLMPTLLYLADYRLFSSREFYGNVLYVRCDAPNPPGDGMYIREDLDLLDLYNVISDCLLDYQRMRQNEEALFNNLYAGKGIPGLLQIAYVFLDNPVVVLDSIFSTIAYYPEVNEPLFESRNNVLILNNHVLSTIKNANIIHRIHHSVYPFKVYIDDLGYELIFESIRIQRAVVGYLCIRCVNHGIDDGKFEYIHALTQMISIQLHQSDNYQNPYGIKYDLFLKHLFIKNFETEENARKHLGFLIGQLKTSFYLVAAGFSEKTARRMANDRYCQQLSNTFPNSITGMVGDRFITLISTDDLTYFTTAILDRFEAFLTMNKMKAAVSYVFDELLTAKDFLEQCMSQLDYMLVSYTERPVGFYADHYIRQLVELCGSYDILKASIHPSILRMDSYDRQHQTSYLETLVTYFSQNRSAPATAKALFIHKSTLFYRFGKMSSLFQIDLEDKDALFAYEYSLHVLEIIKAIERKGAIGTKS